MEVDAVIADQETTSQPQMSFDQAQSSSIPRLDQSNIGALETATTTDVDALKIVDQQLKESSEQPIDEKNESSPVREEQIQLGESEKAEDSLAQALSNLDGNKKSAKFVKAKDYLSNQTKVYDHLSHLVLKILQLKPKDPLDEFENISRQVKFERSLIPDNKTAESSDSSLLASHERVLALFQNNTSSQMESLSCDLPDILDLANVFAWAGVSLGTEETYRVFLAIKRLAIKNELKSVRFFGKVFGTQLDYFIVEADRNDEAEDNYNPPVGFPQKEIGFGVNKYVYFVCNDVTGEWTRLPDVIPQLLQQSRTVQKFLTGDLKAKIDGYPVFDGTEADYLRCQIARISSSTVISPNGYYMIDESSEDEAVLNPDFEWPSNEALTQADNWVHHIPYILPQGRTKFAPVSKGENDHASGEEGEEDDEEESESEEEGPPILTSISEDSDMDGDINAWTIRLSSQLVLSKYATVVIRNNRWPGAFTVGYNDRFSNIYVGWGLKDHGKPFVPSGPGPVSTEYLNIEEDAENPDVKILKPHTELHDPSVEEEEAVEMEKRRAEQEQLQADADQQEDDNDGEEEEED